MEQKQPNSNQALQVFSSPQFGQIRTAGTSEQPLFCLADICKILDLRTDAVKSRLKDAPILIGVIDSMGREQTAMFVNESNLYKVIMRSDKPQAEAFQDWVCGEVLPEIRKNGAYVAAQPNETPELLMARALKAADQAIKRQQAELQAANDKIRLQGEQIEANKQEIVKLAPKAEYCDQVLQSDSTHAISDVAKELGMSGPKLYEKLRIHRILFKRGGKWFPYDKFVPKGYFATRTIPFMHRDGSQGSSSYTVLTEIGRQWIHTLNQRNAIA